jgi:hypothetical protein
VAISEAVKEIRFIHYLLNNMGVKVEIPITVRCDNVGAIFMACAVNTLIRAITLFVNILRIGSSNYICEIR